MERRGTRTSDSTGAGANLDPRGYTFGQKINSFSHQGFTSMGRLLTHYIDQMSSHSITNGSRVSSQRCSAASWSFGAPPTARSDVSISDAESYCGFLTLTLYFHFRAARLAILSRNFDRETSLPPLRFCHARTFGAWHPARLFEPQNPSPYFQRTPRRSPSHPCVFTLYSLRQISISTGN